MSETVSADMLPADVREAFAAAIDAKARSARGERNAFNEEMLASERAYQLAGIPTRGSGPSRPFPLPSGLSEQHRAVLTYAATHDLTGGRGFDCPSYPYVLRRWLGIDPGTMLETLMVEVEHDGVKTSEPLWRALQLKPGREPEIFDALPLDVAIRAFTDALSGANYVDSALINYFQNGQMRLARELRDEARDWAIARADALVKEPRSHVSQFSSDELLVLFALVRAGVPIEERWEVLYRCVGSMNRAMAMEVVGALPAERRVRALGPTLAYNRWSMEMLAAWPSAQLAEAVLASAEPYSQRWTWLVSQVREVGKKSPAVAALAERIVATLPEPVSLFVTRRVYPQKPAELSPLEREQLRIGARGYDEQDLDAETRLADDGSETSVLGTLAIHNVCDERGTPLFDVLVYFGDAGIICRAGTTEAVGFLGQGGVELNEKNVVLRAALQGAIGPNAKLWKAKKSAAKGAAAKKKPTATKKKPAATKKGPKKKG